MATQRQLPLNANFYRNLPPTWPIKESVFVASKIVGPTGRVIGVDMTLKMLSVAPSGAQSMGARTM